jgi:hypothetical protein
MDLPMGTVKSAAYYGIKKLRSQLEREYGGPPIKIKPRKGVSKMKNCNDVYGVLFEYAKGYLSETERTDVQSHIKSCATCARVAGALTDAWPYLQREFNENNCYFNVGFQLEEELFLTYTGYNYVFSNAKLKAVNEMLAENNGCIPDGQTIMGSGFDRECEILSQYCNEGGKVEFDIHHAEYNKRIINKRMTKVYPEHWTYFAFVSPRNVITQSPDAPNLYFGENKNNFGQAIKGGIFVHLPDNAVNVRIKQGSGVLRTGESAFAYTQLYLKENEAINVTFTYNV